MPFPRRRTYVSGLPFFAFALALLWCSSAVADTAILDNMARQYRLAADSWFSRLYDIAWNLFMMLAAIELTWSAAWWVFDKGDLPDIFVAFLKRMVVLSFFLMVLIYAHSWIPAIIQGFREAAGYATGNTAISLSPSSVVDQGIGLSKIVFEDATSGGFIASVRGGFLAALTSLILIICFAIIAGQFLVTLVESYIVIGGGVLFLGFAGSRWTIGFAEKYLGYGFGTGVKLFILLLIVGVGQDLAVAWGPTLLGGGWEGVAAVLGAAVLYVMLVWQVPSFAAALMSGMPSLSLGGAVGSIGGTAYAAASLGGMAAMATTGGMSTIAGAGMRAVNVGTAAAAHGGAAAMESSGARGAVTAISSGLGAMAGEVGSAAKDRISDSVSKHSESPLANQIRERTAAEFGGGSLAKEPPGPASSSTPTAEPSSGSSHSRSRVTDVVHAARHINDDPPPATPPVRIQWGED